MSKEYALDGLALEFKAHWETYRPKMCRELERELPTDCSPLPRLLYSVEEVAEMLG